MKDLAYAVICVALCIPTGVVLGDLVHDSECVHQRLVC
ncbi:MAG: hypothetical protein JWR60_3055 [Polaromonas sp.]|nr:hypothetical protein [Polaromonas sp.]